MYKKVQKYKKYELIQIVQYIQNKIKKRYKTLLKLICHQKLLA